MKALNLGRFRSMYKTLCLAVALLLITSVVVYAGIRGARALKAHFGASISNLVHGRVCTVHIVKGQMPRAPVSYSDVADGAFVQPKVATDCTNPGWRNSKLSFHVYSQSARLLRWNNPKSPLRENDKGGYGFIRLSLANLAALGETQLTIKPDLINSRGAWASKDFFTTAFGSSLYVDQQAIAARLTRVMAKTRGVGSPCSLSLRQSQPASLNYGYKRLARQKVVNLQVKTQCRKLAGLQLIYHVLDGRGRFVARHGPTSSSDTASENSGIFKPAAGSKQSAHKPLQATLSIPMADYTNAAPGKLTVVPDVLNSQGSLLLHGRLRTSTVNINYRLENLRSIYQIVPFIMPDTSIGFAPVIYDFYSPDGDAAGFKVSESFVTQPSHRRFDTWRHKLPPLEQGNNMQFTWVSYITPTPGTYSVHAAFFYNPYLWYSDAFDMPRATTHVMRLRWFVLCAVAGLVLFVSFLTYAWTASAWLEKTIFWMAALILVYPIIIPILLSELGWVTVFTLAFIYLVSRCDVRKDAAAMIVSAALFGLGMELYWGTILQTYWYGIMLSVAAQALAVAFICLLVRRPNWRLAVVVGWCVIWLCLYAGVDIYLVYFGEAPRLSVFSYAGQGVTVSKEIVSLIRPEQIIGILLGLVYVAGFVLSPWLPRLHDYVKHLSDQVSTP